jgi:ankyrin repeat protein
MYISYGRSRNNDIEAIAHLIECGIDLNHRDQLGHKPFFEAIKQKLSFEVLQLLVDSGASCKDDSHATDCVRAYTDDPNSFKFVKLVLKGGYEVNDLIKKHKIEECLIYRSLDELSQENRLLMVKLHS